MFALTTGDAAETMRLLRLLRVHLRSAIESSLVPGTGKAMGEDRDNVAEDRRDFRIAGRLIKKLGAQGAEG